MAGHFTLGLLGTFQGETNLVELEVSKFVEQCVPSHPAFQHLPSIPLPFFFSLLCPSLSRPFIPLSAANLATVPVRQR